MIKIENDAVYGWEAAIRGMRNPMNSWNKSDSRWANGYIDDDHKTVQYAGECNKFQLGKADRDLMRNLVAAGSDHGKFLRMINVTVDVVAPLYWWKEFDTYKVGTVANSCSTMHKISAKLFALDDFSHEHLTIENKRLLETLISILNAQRDKYIKAKENYADAVSLKRYWWQMIQLLPSSYNQRRTIQLNYEVLRRMYHSRKNHKLDEWRTFCKWVESLPYSELICG